MSTIKNYLAGAPRIEHAFAPAPLNTLDEIAQDVPAPRLSLQPKEVVGDRKVLVYLAHAPHLQALSQTLGVPLVKIGLTTGRVWSRINALSEKGYAGHFGRSAEDCVELAGAHQWKPVRLDKKKADAGLVHARVDENGDILMKIPANVDRQQLDESIHHVLASRSLEAFMASDVGRIRCAQHGVDQAAFLWTRYPAEGNRPTRICRSREIYLLDPRDELAMLTKTLDRLAAHFQAQARTPWR